MVGAFLAICLGALGGIAVLALSSSSVLRMKEQLWDMEDRLDEYKALLDSITLVAQENQDIDPYTAPIILTEVGKLRR